MLVYKPIGHKQVHRPQKLNILSHTVEVNMRRSRRDQSSAIKRAFLDARNCINFQNFFQHVILLRNRTEIYSLSISI